MKSPSLSLLAVLLCACPTPARDEADDAKPAADRPNVLFVIADDWGWPHAGVLGCDWVATPNFDRVAQDGVLFKNCFTSNPKCSPCRASILTGRNTWQTGAAINHFGIFPHDWPVYPEVLEKAGYKVGYTGKGWGPGDYEAGGFDRNPAGPNYSRIKTQPPYGGIANTDYAANFAAFLDEKKEGEPFSFWLGTHEPHQVYEIGSGVRSGKKPGDVDLPGFYPNDKTIRKDLLDYSLEVEWFDTHLGRALKHLEDRGLLENTLVVVTSDHGMPFPRVKGQIYEWGFHIPLAVMWPAKVKAGRTVEDLINVRDFMPTFLEAAGVEVPPSVTGTSILGILTGTAQGWVEGRKVMLVGKERHDVGRPDDAGYPVRAIRTDQYLYVHNFTPDRWPAGNPETNYNNTDDSPTKTALISRFNRWYQLSFGKRPAEELFDIQSDPDCLQNLANDPGHRAAKHDLTTRMFKMLADEGDPRALGREEIFHTYRYTGNSTHGWEDWARWHLAPEPGVD